MVILAIRVYDDMIFDVRLWGCDGHFEYTMILWWNRLYRVSYPRVWFGDLRAWKGGGGSGIGGIKSSTQIHEFCIVRSLKICTNLGCKWGVPLVIGGGGPDFGVLGILGMSLWGSCRLSSYPIIASSHHHSHRLHQCSCSSVSDAILSFLLTLYRSTLIVTTLYSIL